MYVERAESCRPPAGTTVSQGCSDFQGTSIIAKYIFSLYSCKEAVILVNGTLGHFPHMWQLLTDNEKILGGVSEVLKINPDV